MGALVELKNITRSFGGVRALKGIDFDLQPGEVHALLGENGAGKSTLMRVLAGEIAPDGGAILVDGTAVATYNPRVAASHGIAVIHQETALAPDLSVAENIFLRELPGVIAWPALNRRAGQLLRRLGFSIDPRRAVGDLAVAHQQVVEIAKALSQKVRVIVFDEPTAVLSTADAERLHGIIAGLRAEGVGIVYISHRLEEVFRIADRMTVMKDGRVVGVTTPRESGVEDVIRMMVGRPLAALFPKAEDRRIGEEVLRVEDLRRGTRVRGVSLSVRAGEIVGLGGLVGSGRTETVRLVFGADRRDAGRIFLRGREAKISTPLDAVLAGIGLVPEDRKHQGVILDMAIRDNTTMARLAPVVNALGFLRLRLERATVEALVEAAAPEERRRRCARIEPVGRQSAEGGPGQVVPCRHGRHHPRRAHPRRRRRCQGRDLCPDRGARGGRQSRAGHLLRASGTVRPLRPRAGHGRGRPPGRTPTGRLFGGAPPHPGHDPRSDPAPESELT